MILLLLRRSYTGPINSIKWFRLHSRTIFTSVQLEFYSIWGDFVSLRSVSAKWNKIYMFILRRNTLFIYWFLFFISTLSLFRTKLLISFGKFQCKHEPIYNNLPKFNWTSFCDSDFINYNHVCQHIRKKKKIEPKIQLCHQIITDSLLTHDAYLECNWIGQCDKINWIVIELKINEMKWNSIWSADQKMMQMSFHFGFVSFVRSFIRLSK